MKDLHLKTCATILDVAQKTGVPEIMEHVENAAWNSDHEKNLQFNVSHDNEKSLSSNSRNSIIMLGPTFLVQFGLLRVSLLWTFEDGDGEVTLDEFLDEHGHKADLLR